LINDKLFALELHFVHGSTVNREQKAVLGVLFQAVKKDTPNLSQISRIAGMIVNTSNPEFDATLNLTFVMPSDRTRFYYYEGANLYIYI
jgi:carbonic anhydrase